MKKQYELFINIRRSRKRLGLSQNDLAKKLGVSGKTISAYETGRAIPPFPTLEKLASIMGLSVTELTSATKDTAIGDNYDRIKKIEERLSNVEQLLLKLLNKDSHE